MAEKIKVLLSEEEVDSKIKEIGEQISKDYEGRQVFYVRTGKEDHCSGFSGFYVSV